MLNRKRSGIVDVKVEEGPELNVENVMVTEVVPESTEITRAFAELSTMSGGFNKSL